MPAHSFVVIHAKCVGYSEHMVRAPNTSEKSSSSFDHHYSVVLVEGGFPEEMALSGAVEDESVVTRQQCEGQSPQGQSPAFAGGRACTKALWWIGWQCIWGAE